MDCGLGFICAPKSIGKNHLMQFFAEAVSILLGIEKMPVSILMLSDYVIESYMYKTIFLACHE